MHAYDRKLKNCRKVKRRIYIITLLKRVDHQLAVGCVYSSTSFSIQYEYILQKFSLIWYTQSF